MNGWQRFALLLMCCFTVMVLYPNFGPSGWTFAGMALAMWTGAIIILSVISNLLGIYNFQSLNKLISFLLLCAIMYSLLWYFPQDDKVTPINKIKYGEIPSKADLEKGISRFTFNFDFVSRQANQKENFINQETNSKQLKKKQTLKPEELEEQIDITVE